MELHDGVEPEDRLHGCRTLAAAVRMSTDIGRQHRSKRFRIAARGGEEGPGKLKAALFVDFRVEVMHGAGKAAGRQPLRHRVSVIVALNIVRVLLVIRGEDDCQGLFRLKAGGENERIFNRHRGSLPSMGADCVSCIAY